MMQTFSRNFSKSLTLFSRAFSTSHVAIIGCTPAALCAAIKVCHSGKTPIIFERKKTISECAKQMMHGQKKFFFGPNYFSSSIIEITKSFNLPVSFMPDRHVIYFYNDRHINIPFEIDKTYNPRPFDGESTIYGLGKDEKTFHPHFDLFEECMNSQRIQNIVRILDIPIDESLRSDNKYLFPVVLTNNKLSIYEILKDELERLGGTIKFETEYCEHFPCKGGGKQLVFTDLKTGKKFNQIVNPHILNFSPALATGVSSEPSLSTTVLFITCDRKGMGQIKNYHHLVFMSKNFNDYTFDWLNQGFSEEPDKAPAFKLLNTHYLTRDESEECTLIAYIPTAQHSPKTFNKNRTKIKKSILSRIDCNVKNFQSSVIDDKTTLYSARELKHIFGIDSGISRTILLPNSTPEFNYTRASDMFNMENNSSTDSDKVSSGMRVGAKFAEKLFSTDSPPTLQFKI